MFNKQLAVYLVPSNNGVFNLSKSSTWEVNYTLGVKVIEGEGVLVNISTFSKGMYLLKTKNGIGKRLLYQ